MAKNEGFCAEENPDCKLLIVSGHFPRQRPRFLVRSSPPPGHISLDWVKEPACEALGLRQLPVLGTLRTTPILNPFHPFGVELFEIQEHREGQLEMSIMPEGGWVDPPRQDTQQRPDYPQQPTSTPRSSYLTCKICDRGALSSKSIFRMSGPAVVIGSILLIPSILGIICSALMFIGVNVFAFAYDGNETGSVASQSGRSYQSEFDVSFRRSCATNFKRSYYQASGLSAPQPLVEQYCECTLSNVKETGSVEVAAQTCIQRVKDGNLDTPSENVDALYSGGVSHEKRLRTGLNPLRAAFSVFGSSLAIGLGITSFVGGLLGWLLVMRKRVLQCNICGAVVNAS